MQIKKPNSLFDTLDISNFASYLLCQPNFFKIVNDDSITDPNITNQSTVSWSHLKSQWHLLQIRPLKTQKLETYSILSDTLINKLDKVDQSNEDFIAEIIEPLEVNWLISVFNKLFAYQNVQLTRGNFEPEYFPAQNDCAARIVFAHGFFSSALHELSHWCIAGAQRRTLLDFGYWYAADGRNEAQQKAFEKVEIKPQSTECLFTLMCNKNFRVSQDNLFAEFDTGQSSFEQDVFKQANLYILAPDTLPVDARIFLTTLAYLCHDNHEH